MPEIIKETVRTPLFVRLKKPSFSSKEKSLRISEMKNKKQVRRTDVADR